MTSLYQITTVLVACFIISILGQEFASAQNSTQKIRAKPSSITAKIGSSVNWEPNFKTAMAKAKETGKPVFWYVSTLPGTFMDRKTEIDRYMLSGPFSWPAIVSTINDQAIATRAVPGQATAKTYNLLPYKFIEPGIVILSPAGEVVYSIDRLTTVHPRWLLKLLQEKLQANKKPALYEDVVVEAWSAFAKADHDSALQLAKKVDSNPDATDAAKVEAQLLVGMCQFRQGDHDQAIATWSEAAKRYPNLALGQKCAAESQKIGPFYRGFEIHRDIPNAAMQAGLDSIGSAAPKNAFSEQQLWTRSTEFLLGMQHKNGGFYDSDYDFGGTDSLPNVYVAVTSLAGMALLRVHDQAIAEDATYDQKVIQDSINRALKFVTDRKNINRADRDEILWAYAFRLRFIARCKTHQTLKFSSIDLDKALAECVESLQSVQSKRGNWYHEYGNPFVTATALLALQEASKAGGEVSAEIINKGLASLSRDRLRNGAFPYSNARAKRDGKPRDIVASAGRMPLCELALYQFEKSDQKNLTVAVTKSLELHDSLDSALKYDNHTSNLAYGGFFFWYDMRSRSEAILNVKDFAKRREFQQRHKALILELPELDGCFIDSHELGRVYGTSMAILSLANVNQK